ncbi:MAG: acetylornithine deacetylase [Salinarimonadaceae bacterium]|nr:MAG: acetylornithine deacetylase [Salinarimonadaceae bacterium]
MTNDRIVSILSTLVAFDTTSRNSNLELIAWVEAFLQPLGFRMERIYDETGTKANLWASIGPVDAPGFILSGHTDVVPVDGQAWSSDPFTLRAEGGRIYGRGTCDMKGFLAACLARAQDMAIARLARPIHLAFSYDEEIGCVGGRQLAEWIARQPVQPEACFVGEPSNMQVVIGHKGKLSMIARVRGLTRHSSLAPEGVNAVEFGALLVAEIRRIAEELQASGPRDALYDVPHSTAHVGIMRGGTALNIVPDECEIRFEVRVVGQDDADSLVARIVDYARSELEPRMRAVDPATGIDFEMFAGFPGLDTAPDEPVATLAKRLAARNDHAKVAYGTEGGLFHRVAGVPTVIVGPGSIAQAHQADEWIAEVELAKCDAFVANLIAHCEAR